mgnify:CR=1 FL=1
MCDLHCLQQSIYKYLWHLHVAFYKYGNSDNSLLSIDDAVALKICKSHCNSNGNQRCMNERNENCCTIAHTQIDTIINFFRKISIKMFSILS